MEFKRLKSVGSNFWNVRGSFKIMFGLLDIGTHMSIVRLNSGKFVVIDTVEMTPDLKQELDQLTDNGSMIEAVLGTHPYHTSYFKAFYQCYPNAKYIGAPRHLKVIPEVPWESNSLADCQMRKMFEPELYMDLPAGSEFIDPKPPTKNHFSCCWVYHPLSKTIHVDDTINYYPIGSLGWVGRLFGFKEDRFSFHPSVSGAGLHPHKEAPLQFKAWMEKILNDWDFDNVCSAHLGAKLGNAKEGVQQLVSKYDFEALVNKSRNDAESMGWDKSSTECG